MNPKSRLQRWLFAVLPASWAAALEASSRSWFVCCPCGVQASVWELGGIRWKASGEPRIRRRCSRCQAVTWQIITQRPPSTPSLSPLPLDHPPSHS